MERGQTTNNDAVGNNRRQRPKGFFPKRMIALFFFKENKRDDGKNRLCDENSGAAARIGSGCTSCHSGADRRARAREQRQWWKHAPRPDGYAKVQSAAGGQGR